MANPEGELFEFQKAKLSPELFSTMKMPIKADLEIAKNTLHKKDLTLVIVKEAKVLLESRAHGVSAFLEALERLGAQMKGASIADKVVGKAVALLCVHAGIQAVYASTLSLKAKQVLEKNAIYLEWETVVDRILNTSGIDICPFEKAVMETDDPKEAYEKLKAFQKPEEKNAMKSEYEGFISTKNDQLKRIREENSAN